MKAFKGNPQTVRFRFPLDTAAESYSAPPLASADLGFDYSGICRPAQELSCNFLESEALPGGKVVFAIGDNTIPSHTFPVLCIRHYLRRSLLRDTTSPILVAARISELIYDCCASDCAVSCFYAQYTKSSGILRYVNAGHDVPLLIRRNPDEVLRLEQSGPVFGLCESPRYVEGVVQLRNGDRLIAFTQGIIDGLAAQHASSAESTLIELARCRETSSAFDIANRVLAECGDTRLDQSVFVACVDEARPFALASAAMQTSSSYFVAKANS